MIFNIVVYNNLMSLVILLCVVIMFNMYWIIIDINIIFKIILIKNCFIVCKWYFFVIVIWIIVLNIINDIIVLMFVLIMLFKWIKMILSINLIINFVVILIKIGFIVCCVCNNVIFIIINDI